MPSLLRFIAVSLFVWSSLVAGQTVSYFPVPAGSGPHDVAPAADGTVWYTAQRQGALGRLDPITGKTQSIPLGPGSAPHGVIVGPDGAAWVTDSGQNAILRVDSTTQAVQRFPLPPGTRWANLNTAAFDHQGRLWFTGQAGIYGRLDPRTRQVQVFEAPGGAGPYGITITPAGEVYYASLAGGYLAQIDPTTGLDGLTPAYWLPQNPSDSAVAGFHRSVRVVKRGVPLDSLGERASRRSGRDRRGARRTPGGNGPPPRRFRTVHEAAERRWRAVR